MSLFARIALGLALVLPLTAYVAGSLIAAEPAPAQYAPIELRETSSSTSTDPGLVDPNGEAPDESTSPSPSPTATSTLTATPGPSKTPKATPKPSPTLKPSPTPKPGPSKKPGQAEQPEVVRPGAIDPDDDDYDDIDDDDDTTDD